MFLTKRIVITSLLASLATLPLCAQTAAPSHLGETDAKWPGVKLKISELIRIDATHVLAGVQINAGAAAPVTTTIGEMPKFGFVPPPHVTREELESGKYSAKSYSLTDAVVVDEITQQKIRAATDLPPKPYLGPNSIVITLHRNTGIQLSVLLNVPPPQPAGSDGKFPPQNVIILLPNAKNPIEHVLLPAPTPVPKPTPAATPSTAAPAATAPAAPVSPQ